MKKGLVARARAKHIGSLFVAQRGIFCSRYFRISASCCDLQFSRRPIIRFVVRECIWVSIKNVAFSEPSCHRLSSSKPINLAKTDFFWVSGGWSVPIYLSISRGVAEWIEAKRTLTDAYSRDVREWNIANVETLLVFWYFLTLSCDAVGLLLYLQKEALDILQRAINMHAWYDKYTTENLPPEFVRVAFSHMKHVAGDSIWLKTNPGQQDSLLTGSFHPMSRCAIC